MKHIIKLILIALTIVCAINCSDALFNSNEMAPRNEETSTPTSSNDTTDDSSYELKQKHFEIWHQVESYFGSDEEYHRIIDVNKVWLEYSNGDCSDSIFFKISYAPKYTDQISCKNPESYINSTIYYDNGFKIEEELIECSFIPENTDNLIFTVNDKNIEIPFHELQFCSITPISLHIDRVENSYIYATLLIETYHPDNVLAISDSTEAVESTETIEISMNIKFRKKA